MRKLIFVVLFILIGLSYLFKVDELIAQKFTIANQLKSFYIEKATDITSKVEKHISQVDTIDKLKAENNELKEYKILYSNSQKQLENLKESFSNIQFPETKSSVEFVRVLSYIDFSDFSKVWLDKEYEKDAILGLISDNYAAGIVVNKNGKSIGLLNGNIDCSYGVFIGDEKSPGILTSLGENQELLQIKYIPIWANINKGDEVVTSGMDNIFFEGLKVGRIEEITNFQDMKMATVKPYINVLKKKYFFIYKNTPHIELKEKKIQAEKKIDINN